MSQRLAITHKSHRQARRPSAASTDMSCRAAYPLCSSSWSTCASLKSITAPTASILHTRDLLRKGQKIEKLALVQAWAEAGNLFDDRERAALAWAETVTRVAETGVPDKAYQAARAVFEERELVDLTIAIGLMNAYNRMAISFRNPPQAAQ